MAKRLSIIIAVNDAREDDLAIPLSSINNQLGIDFRDVEVILVDNGQYRLQNVDQFRLFKNLDVHYENPANVLSWEEAFQHGVGVANGDYVMFMGPDGLLNQTSVIQTFSATAAQNQDADVLTGLVLEQDMTRTRTTQYKVGRDFMTARGRWFKRAFLNQYHVAWQAVGKYSDEFYSRLVNCLSRADIEVNEIAYAQFLSRDIRSEVLAPMPRQASVEQITMLGKFFETLQQIDPMTYINEFSKACVRYYTQSKQVPETERDRVDQAFWLLVQNNAGIWQNVQALVEHLKLTDQSPEAPWVKEPQLFDGYIQALSKVAATKN
ncbi:glycosyl transferase [Secundilactobacillus pentosiphilus]|uniref:Glycosyl transferase n=1 Tax=Secundilactobacillus pentosiphilus TaxID=1714682 RepID=A0A1Z5IY89_9LACO|nr:glycosyltransferase family A protein [Secundilactobacillus pentosiphilus]GAX06542.1 glycosyl transferase [Secundilactobacillus pentosiphilus]